MEKPLSAGVAEGTLRAVQEKTDVAIPDEAELVDFVRELCRSGAVADARFETLRSRLGRAGAVELAAAVGHYSMIALVLSAYDAC